MKIYKKILIILIVIQYDNLILQNFFHSVCLQSAVFKANYISGLYRTFEQVLESYKKKNEKVSIKC